ncbi:RNA-directed DNA polymerase, eukaryota [Tanacetum coccineum]
MNSVVLSSSKDRWTCDLSGDGEFKVKDIRNFIDDLLPTRVNLSRRGVLLDSHLCPLCNAAMEDVQHVFFRCDVARVVLRKICRWWDLDWQEICSFSDWDAWFLSFRLSSRLKSILEDMKKHIEIIKYDEVAIDAIPLATKPPMIVDYKIVKEGKLGYFQLIRADGSSKRYLSMIKMLQNIDREDLETL